jgi:zinc transporter ZupT
VQSPLLLPVLVFAVALIGILFGIRLSAMPLFSRRLVPFSGGVLLGIAGFWVMPEMAAYFGWPGVLLWVLAGFAGLWLIDRYVYPVCPSCSHTHDHDHCNTRLHGFAAPMLIAAGLHSFLDGWLLAAAGQSPLGDALVAGIALHKIPEGLALGVIVRSAMKSRRRAIAGCAAAELLTIIGAGFELQLAPRLGFAWAHGLLAVAAGSFLYLGYHAIHSEYKRRGVMPAFVPALTGVAGSSVIRLFAVWRNL